MHTGIRNALVAPEKKRVWISSGKLKATMKASTSSVAPKRYAWMASRTYPSGRDISVMIVMIEPCRIISSAGFLRAGSDAFCSNILSLDDLAKFVQGFLFDLANAFPRYTEGFPDEFKCLGFISIKAEP